MEVLLRWPCLYHRQGHCPNCEGRAFLEHWMPVQWLHEFGGVIVACRRINEERTGRIRTA
jgi:hypothetical protein